MIAVQQRVSATGLLQRPVDLHALVERVVANESRAWRALQVELLPRLERWARGHAGMRRRRLGGSVDDVREVVTATLERLHADGFANLRRYLGHQPEQGGSFESWLYGALDFAVRDHLRTRFGRTSGCPHIGEATPDRRALGKRDLNTLAPRFDEEHLQGVQSGVTSKMTLDEVLTYVRKNFATEEARALQLYLERDASFEDIAAELGLSGPLDAERLIRKLKERLRVRFRSPR